MTANFRTADYVPTSLSPAGVATSSPRIVRIRAITEMPDRVAFAILTVGLLLLYGLLQNQYWVPAGDSELYTAAARNMALGHGYTFLGQPVAISPPGWSFMMSIVMRATSLIWPLKLMAMACMTASLLMGYWVARRFVSPTQAVCVILLTAVISHVYQATYWLISEGSFCLATTASILLAMQIAEGRRQWWRIALLLFACVAAVSIRWAGVLGVIVVVACLLDGQLKPKLSITWITAVLVCVVSVVTFFGWRHGLRGTPAQVAAAQDMVTGTGEDTGTIPVTDVGPPVVGTTSQNAQTYALIPAGSPVDRVFNWGRWFSYLYWQPFRAAGASKWILRGATFTGWVVIAVLSVLVVFATMRKKWLWLAVGMYTGALAVGWPNVNARYYVPVAFLITLGMFLATDELLRLTTKRRAAHAFFVVCFIAFVGSVALCNGALWTVEMAIARSERFYARYEDGMNMPLIQACQYLRGLPQPPQNGDLAVSPRYTNLNRSKASPFGIRATVLLTGLDDIQNPKWKLTAVPPNSNTATGRDVRKWLKSKQIKWYLYQTEIEPWRVWHFRLDWYEKMQLGMAPNSETVGWQLYRASPTNDDWIPVRLPNKFMPVTRVPGL